MTPGVVLDTCVVSELNRSIPNLVVRQAIETRDAGELFISVMTIGEIRQGIEMLPPGRKRRGIEDWAKHIETVYSDRILPVDVEIARLWAEVSVAARKLGRQVATIDGLIAATALRHGLSVMTRNVDDFEPTGVSIIDPWRVA